MWAVAHLQGSDLWNDGHRFKKFAHASLELSKVYVELSSLNNSRRELFAAEMHLKNTIKQVSSLVFSSVLSFLSQYKLYSIYVTCHILYDAAC